MAWLHKNKNGQWRLLDRRNGKIVTLLKRLGAHKGLAESAKVRLGEAMNMGFTFDPPTAMPAVEAFIKARKEGKEFDGYSRRLPIEEMCDLYLRIHGPDLKGGVSHDYRSAYYGLQKRLEQIKRSCLAGKCADEITKFDVRDFISQFNTVGTKMRWIAVLGHMFRYMEVLNEDDPKRIKGPVRLPKYNPVTKWRATMKPQDKREDPDTRVLTRQEWAQFSQYLTPRCKAICEVALARLLRKSDIRRICHASIENGHIVGIQQKTGSRFSVPVMGNQSVRYDFTNFVREFKQAQVAAGLDYPSDHKLHFSFKDLRRTGATWYYNKTKDLRRVQKMLGHAKLSTTERYLHISEVDLAEAARTMDEMVLPKQGSDLQSSRKVANAQTPTIPPETIDTMDYMEFK